MVVIQPIFFRRGVCGKEKVPCCLMLTTGHRYFKWVLLLFKTNALPEP